MASEAEHRLAMQAKGRRFTLCVDTRNPVFFIERIRRPIGQPGVGATRLGGFTLAEERRVGHGITVFGVLPHRGPGAGRNVRKTAAGDAICLAEPIMRKGAASVTFKISERKPDAYTIGVFAADTDLDGDPLSPNGKRCVLRVWGGYGGGVSVLCDGERSGAHVGIDWEVGDTFEVSLGWESAKVAKVGFRLTRRKGILYSRGETVPIMEFRHLKGVPKCGLCFGVGLTTEGHGIQMEKSWFDPGEGEEKKAVAEYGRAAPITSGRRMSLLGNLL